MPDKYELPCEECEELVPVGDLYETEIRMRMGWRATWGNPTDREKMEQEHPITSVGHTPPDGEGKGCGDRSYRWVQFGRCSVVGCCVPPKLGQLPPREQTP